ncbi:MAG TPA: hypothetical protein VJO52_02460 [Gemmatimonadaceae bacterium]|nr:hypothetical protein [Gemmatimonadaceae bacterium]
MRVELITFEGCPHAAAARTNVRTALSAAGLSLPLDEWDRESAAAPAYTRRYPSPTVLVNGRDVSAETGGTRLTEAAAACRAGGAPSVAAILVALRAP